MRTSAVVDAIIFTGRNALTKLAADQLRMKGVSNIVTPAIAEECIDALARFPKALLIIDWQIGSGPVSKVLSKDRKKRGADHRPILLVAAEVSQTLIATAAEYNVAQIFTEQLSPKAFSARLTTLLLGEAMPSDIKKLFADVTEARDKKDFTKAAQMLQVAVQKNPTNHRLKTELAESLLMDGKPDRALKALEGIEAAKPPYLRGITLLGRCLSKLGRFDEAARAFETANLFNPNDIERLVDLGAALMQMDRLKEAEETFDRALALDPESRPAKVGLGTVKLVDGAVNDALAILRDVSGDIELASIFNTSAVLNMRQKRHEAGMQLYQAALKTLGKNERVQARLYFNMGIGYRRQGQKDKALVCFEQALKLDPAYVKAKTQIAVVSAADTAGPLAFKSPDKASEAPVPAEALSSLAEASLADDTEGMLDFSTDFGDFGSEEDDQLDEGLYD